MICFCFAQSFTRPFPPYHHVKKLNNEFFFFVNSDLTIQSLNTLMRNNDEVDEGTLQKWDDWYFHLLIAAYDHHKHLFKTSRGKLTKKQVFQKIAEYFSVTADVTASGDQCLHKWTKLEQKYKEVEDNNKRTGNGRKDWKFLDNTDANISCSSHFPSSLSLVSLLLMSCNNVHKVHPFLCCSVIWWSLLLTSIIISSTISMTRQQIPIIKITT